MCLHLLAEVNAESLLEVDPLVVVVLAVGQQGDVRVVRIPSSLAIVVHLHRLRSQRRKEVDAVAHLGQRRELRQ